MHKIHHHLHNFFIPHEGNDHLPHSVRHKSLLTYSGFLVTFKTLLVVSLFITFPSLAEFSTITQARIAELVNQVRSEQGLGQVRISPRLQKAAELKLADMIENTYFAHSSPTGVVPWTWFKEAGYLYTFAGENLAMNFTQAEEAHQAWLDSPTHRANILNKNYKEIGIAVGVGEIDGEPATLVVQLFGTSFVPPVIAQNPTPITQVQGTSLAQGQPQAKDGMAQVSTREAGARLPAQPEIDPDPKPTVETSDITGGAREVTLSSPDKPDVVGWILRFVQKFYWVILGFVALALVLKIVIRAHIQHKRVIFNVVLVLALGLTLLALHIHFLEQISGPVVIF
jgi:hypothetical protein